MLRNICVASRSLQAEPGIELRVNSMTIVDVVLDDSRRSGIINIFVDLHYSSNYNLYIILHSLISFQSAALADDCILFPRTTIRARDAVNRKAGIFLGGSFVTCKSALKTPISRFMIYVGNETRSCTRLQAEFDSVEMFDAVSSDKPNASCRDLSYVKVK